MNNKSKPLSGAHNKRLNSTVPTNSGMNAALTDDYKVQKVTHATIPSEDAVIEAKDWVDNGSRL